MGTSDMTGAAGDSRRDEAWLRAAVRWETAERQLYPLVMSDPELYQLAVQLVVEARELLRAECHSAGDLVEVDAAAVLSRCPTEPSVRERGLMTTVALDAACAARMRELSRS